MPELVLVLKDTAIRKSKYPRQKTLNMKSICILSPSVKTTKEFIAKLNLSSKKIKFLLSKEEEFDFDMFPPLLRLTHLIELFNQFTVMMNKSEQPDLIIMDYTVDFFRTQILEHTPISYNMYLTLESFALEFEKLLNIPPVTKYIALKDVLSLSSYEYSFDEYLTTFAKDYLSALPTDYVMFVDNNSEGLESTRIEIKNLLSDKNK